MKIKIKEDKVQTLRDIDKERNPIANEIVIRNEKPDVPKEDDRGYQQQLSQLFG